MFRTAAWFEALLLLADFGWSGTKSQGLVCCTGFTLARRSSSFDEDEEEVEAADEVLAPLAADCVAVGGLSGMYGSGREWCC